MIRDKMSQQYWQYYNTCIFYSFFVRKDYWSWIWNHYINLQWFGGSQVFHRTAPENCGMAWHAYAPHATPQFSIKPFRIILFKFLYQFIIGQTKVYVKGIEEYIFINFFGFLVCETIAAVGYGIRHECVKQTCSGDYQIFAIITFHDTASIVLAPVVDFSCSHFEFLVMPLRRRVGRSSG